MRHSDNPHQNRYDTPTMFFAMAILGLIAGLWLGTAL